MATNSKLIRKISWIIFILWLFQTNGFCEEINHVTGLHSTSHMSHQTSNNMQINVIWDPPDSGEHNISGYYYRFDNTPDYIFTMDNTSDDDTTYLKKTDPRQAVSIVYKGYDDKPVYCHVAAVDEMNEIIGPTKTSGPYRLDDIAPYPATVIAPSITADSVINLVMGAQRASEMNINNHAYCRGVWEPFQGIKTWSLDEFVGTQVLYVCFKDSAGNISQTQTSIYYDGVIPTVNISSPYTQTSNNSPIPITITFSEEIKGFDLEDISILNGTLSNFSYNANSNGYASVFTMKLNLINEGEIVVTVPQGKAMDLAQNKNIESTPLTVLYDSTSPTVIINSTIEGITNQTKIPVSAIFSEPVFDFTNSDINTMNCMIENFQGQGTEPYTKYTFDVSPSGEGPFTAQIPANRAIDLVGNDNMASSILSFTYDETAPNVVMYTPNISGVVSSPVPITIVIDELARIKSKDEIYISNGTLSSFKTNSSGDYYTTFSFYITPLYNEKINLKIETGAFLDQAGNASTIPLTTTLNFVGPGPSTLVGTDISLPTHLTEIPIWIKFNRLVENFDETDLIITNGHIESFAAISEKYYEMNLIFDSPGMATVSVPAGVAQDLSGNQNYMSAPFNPVYQPNTQHYLAELSNNIIIEDHISSAIPLSISDAEGGTYTVSVQSTSDLFPINANHLTICVDNICKPVLYDGLILAANEIKMLTMFIKPALNANGTSSLTISVSDPIYTVSQSISLEISAINDPPVIALSDDIIIYTENDSPKIISSEASITDPDSPDFSGGRLIVDFVSPQADNHLGIKSQGTDPGMISATLTSIFWGDQFMGTYDGGNGISPLVIDFSNSYAHKESVEALIKCITYENTSERPVDGTIQAQFKLADGDGGVSLTQTVSLSIIPINDPPQVTLSTNPVAYTENQNPVIITPYAQVKDLDAINFRSCVLMVGITKNGTPSDRLNIENQGNEKGEISITGTDVKYGGMRIGHWEGGNNYENPLKVVFNDLATTVSIANLIKAVTYHTDSDMPSTEERTVTFWLTEPDGTSSIPMIRKIPVTSDNDPPEHHVPDFLEVNEDGSLVLSGSSGVYITDPDALENQVRVTINVDNGTFSLGDTSEIFFITGDGFKDVIVSFNGSLDSVNKALDGLTFYPTKDFFGETGITFRTNDQGFSGSGGIPKSDTDPVLIKVHEVPDPPQIGLTDSDLYPDDIVSFPEDTVKSISLSLTDVDGGIIKIVATSLNTTLVPSDYFYITSTGMSGNNECYSILTEIGTPSQLSLIITPAANQNGPGEIQLNLSDSSGMTTTQLIKYDITPVNDPPFITSVSRQTTIEDTVSAPISFVLSDLETAPELLTLTTTVSHPGKVENIFYQGEGEVRSITIMPSLNVTDSVQITVTVLDEELGAYSTSFIMDIVPVNDLPEVSIQTTVEGMEDTMASFFLTLTDVDGDTLSISTISTDESLISHDSIKITATDLTKLGNYYNLKTLPGEPKTLTIFANPSPDKNGKVAIALSIADIGGSPPVIAKTLLDILPVNDAPKIQPILPQITNEDLMTFPISVQLSDIDDNIDTLTVTAISLNPTLVSDEQILVEGTGITTRLSITPLKDQNGTAYILAKVTDSGGLTATTTFSLNIIPVNDQPTISQIDDQITAINIPLEPIPFNINDLETLANNLTLTARSSIKLDMSFSGTGTDRLLNIVNPETYEGIIDITIIVSDAENLTSISNFNLTITEYNDPPTISVIPDQVIDEDFVLEDVNFTISDMQTEASKLKVSIESTNEFLVPLENILLTGSGAMKSLEITPVRNRSGLTLILITVEDVYGLKATTDFTLTVLPDNDQPIMSLISPGACGDRFSLLYDLSGHSYAFGLNDIGQLGLGTRVNQVQPIHLLNGIHRVSAGELHAAAVTVDGNVFIWGSNDFSQLGIQNLLSADTPQALTSLSNIQSIALGNRHSLALDTSGRLWAWGDNAFGQTGTGNLEDTITPQQIKHDSTNQNLPEFIAIAAGQFHSVALDKNGSVWAWGRNDFGQLGDGSLESSSHPMPVKNENGSIFQGAIAIASGGNFILALTNDGDLWAWGDNTSGQLGTGNAGENNFLKHPTKININHSFKAIAAGDQHSLALTKEGFVLAWGDNEYGQLGIGSQAPQYTPVNVLLEDKTSLENVQAIAAGDDHCMAILSNGRVMTWGKNSSGQLGDGTITDRWYPAFVRGFDSESLFNTFVIIEDQFSVPFAWMSADAETESKYLTATAHSMNVSMIADEDISITNINSESLSVITPIADAQGNVQVCFSITDSQNLSVSSCIDIFIMNVNDPPTISNISDQQTNENSKLGPITFTISDLESPPGDLFVTGHSTNSLLVKDENISFVGTGSSRLFFIQTLENINGVVDIVLKVTDPFGLTSTTQFSLNINDCPNIEAKESFSMIEDQSKTEYFKILDVESEPCSITPIFKSSDQTLIDTSNIVYACENNQYSLTLSPETNQSGFCMITIWASDGLAETFVSITVTVEPVNDAPEILLSQNSFAYTENDDPLLIYENATLIDIDSLNFDLARLTVQFIANYEKNDILFVKDSDITGNIKVIELSGNQTVFYSGIPLGTIDAGHNGYSPLTIYLGNNVSQTAMSEMIKQIAYVHQSENPQDSNRLLKLSLTEGDLTVGESSIITIAVTSINDDPQLWLNDTAISTSIEITSLYEKQQHVFDQDHIGQLSVTDPDIIENDLSVKISAQKGIIDINPAHIDKLSQFTGNSMANMSFNAKISDLNDVLNGMIYTALPDEQGKAYIEISIKDHGYTGNGGGDYVVFRINTLIMSDNDPPEIEQIPDQYMNEDTTVQIPFSLTDVDGDNLLLKIESFASDVIKPERITLEGSSIILNENQSYLISLGTEASVALTLVCTPETNKFGVIPIVLTANDQEMYSHVHEFSIHVLEVNDPPYIGGIFTPVAYSEDESPKSICKGIGIYDPDHTQMYQAVVTIEENYEFGDRLSYALAGNVIAESSGNSLTFFGLSHLSDYESVLDSLSFDHQGDDPNENSRIISILVNDGLANSTPITRTVVVSAKNDRPVLLFNNKEITEFGVLPNILEEGQLRFNDEENYLKIQDPDVRNGELTIRISVDKGLLTLNAAATQQLTLLQGQFTDFDAIVFQGKLNDINNALNGMIFWASYEELGEAHLVIQMNDNGFSGEGPGIDIIKLLSFNIKAVNDSPEIAYINGKITLEDTKISFPISITDPESDPLTIWPGSTNNLLIDPSNITFSGDRILFINKNQYIVDLTGGSASITATITPSEDSFGQSQMTIWASDGQLTETRNFSLTVLSVNDPPELTQIPASNFAEGYSEYHLDLNPYVWDIDHTDDKLEWTAQGDPLNISIQNGILNIKTPYPDWYGNVIVDLKIVDPEGLFVNGTVDINILPIEDPPTITDISDKVIAMGADLTNLSFSVNDPEGGMLSIVVTSQNENLIPNTSDALSINNEGTTYNVLAEAGVPYDLYLNVIPDPESAGYGNVCIQVKDSSELSTSKCFKIHVAPYLITAYAGRHGQSEPGGIIAVDRPGSYLPFYFKPDPGYQVDTVIVDGKSLGAVSEYLFYNITSNHELLVTFRPANTYKLWSESGIGGRIEPSEDQTVFTGDSVEYSIIPDTGYAISDVKVDNISVGIVSKYEFENIKMNHQISATFKTIAPPVAQFDANLINGFAPLTVQLINQSTGIIQSYKWEFSDNAASVLPAPVHTFATPGTYSVSLTVAGPGGTHTQVKENWINVQKDPVKIEFQVDQRMGVAPLMVQFIENTQETIFTHEWDFGDGQKSTMQNPSHTYEQPGTYSISLTVTAAGGTKNIYKQNYINVVGRTISGQITGEDIGNQGLKGYIVEVRQNDIIIGETTAENYGFYTVYNLPAKDNLIVSVWPPYESNIYFNQYYNQKDKSENADPVSTLVSDATDIDFVLNRTPENGFTGKVINQTGIQESQSYVVEIWSESIGFGKSVTVDEDGRYSLEGLKDASDYRVYVWSENMQRFFYYYLPPGEIPGIYIPQTSATAWETATRIEPGNPVLSNINIIVHSDPYIRGKVLVEGTPLSNHWVNAWSSTLQTSFGAFTNSQGEYEIMGLISTHNGSPVSYIVEIQDSKYPYQVYDNQYQRENATPVFVNTEHVDFNLSSGASISGTIKDFNGTPLSQVSVSATSQNSGGRGTAVTDANGDYIITGLPPSTDYIVAVYPVYYPVTFYSDKLSKETANPVPVTGKGIENINFILRKGAIIRGYLFIDSTDQTAPSGIWVNIWSESTQTGGDVPTDSTGRYEMTGLDPLATDYIISVISPDYVPSFYSQDSPNQTVHKWENAKGVQASGDIQRNLILTQGVQLSGLVSYNYAPIDGVYIEAWSTETQAWRSVLSTAETDEYGANYVIQGLLPGTYQIKFSHSLYIDTSKAITLSDTSNRLDIVLGKSERQISGKILGLQIGTKATITVWSVDLNISKSIHYSGNGSPINYRFDNLKPGIDYRVELRSTHYPSMVYDGEKHWTQAKLLDISNGNVGGIDFDLPSPGQASISGNIILPEVPVNDFSVWIDAYSDKLQTGKGIEIQVNKESEQTISYKVEGLQLSDDYIVGVWSNVYQDIFYDQTKKRSLAKLVDTTGSVNVTDINFTMSSGGKISGQILDSQGKPVYGMIIEAQSDEKGVYYSAVSDDFGLFQINGLANASDYIIEAHQPGETIQYYSTNGMTTDIAKALPVIINQTNSEIVLSLQLVQTGWIKGKVSDESGKPVSGIWVSAWSETEKTGSSIHTDADGFFEISGLPEVMDFKVTVQAINGTYIDQTRSPIPVYSENIQFVLTKGFLLNGLVSDSDNNPVKKATVTLWSSKSNIYRSTLTTSEGIFNIQGLIPSDDYIIRVSPQALSDLSIFQESGIQLLTQQTRDIVLNDGIKIQGNIEVRDQLSGSWINYTKSTIISVYSTQNNFLASGQSTSGGTYQLSNIPQVSSVILRISEKGYALFETIVDAQFQTNYVDLKLISAANISGCIKNESGRLVENARIIVSSQDAQLAISGISDAQGCFDISGLIKTIDSRIISDYEINVQANGYIAQSKGGKQAGDRVHFTLDQSSQHSITGRIIDRYREISPESVSVVVKLFAKTDQISGGYLGKTLIDENGYFTFDGLEMGQNYNIQCVVMKPGSDMIYQWAANDNGIGRSGATDYKAGDSFEFIIDTVWDERR